jgi:hypothetical protein
VKLNDYLRQAAGVYHYFNQGEIWIPRPPAERVAISSMDPEWRYNAAQLLLRNAARHANTYDWAELPTLLDAPDDVQNDAERWAEERRMDPQAWMRTRCLYRALLRGLPAKRTKLTALAERARHWAVCPARTGTDVCSCEAGTVSTPAEIEVLRSDIKAIQAKDRAAAEAELVRRRRAAEMDARREWAATNPGVDPETNRPWGVDEEGINHSKRHVVNDACHFDSCSACGGYHCGLYCEVAA